MQTKTVVNGTICRIVFPHEDLDYVYKYLINKNTSARELYDRYSRTAERVLHFYMAHYPDCELIIPSMELVEPENCIRQVKVNGKMLGHMSDKEVLGLRQKSIDSLLALLCCAEEIQQENGRHDFLDIFGYDYSYKFTERIRRATDVRYSTNIMVDKNGGINLVDPDFYYVSCRNKITMFFASLFEDRMFMSIKRYKTKLTEMLKV